jgi:hypothetical protein
MTELWAGLDMTLTIGMDLDLELPAAVRGLLLGILYGLVLPVTLIGFATLVELGMRWRRARLARPPAFPVRPDRVPLDDWSSGLEQFSARELARLQRLRRTYRARRTHGTRQTAGHPWFDR